MFPVLISLTEMSQIAGDLPRNIYQFRHLGVEAATAKPESREGADSDLLQTENATDDVALIPA